MTALSQPAIYFFWEEPFPLKNRRELKKFITAYFKKRKLPLRSLNFIFCSDKRLLEINRAFLKHDYYTDIITFDLNPGEKSIEGEIYISVDRVKDNAKSAGEASIKELHRVIFHGILHLTGLNDKTGEEKEQMRRMEDKLLLDYFKAG
jgi:rRNA maturation RNase YbeY